MTRKEFVDSPDAMVVVVWFDHNAPCHSQADHRGFQEFSGDGDVYAQALAYKVAMLEIHPTYSIELIINGAAVEHWAAAISNNPEYQKKGLKKFLGKFNK